MSSNLTPADLTAAVAGFKGSIDWTPVRVLSSALAGSEYAHLQLFNDTGCGLDCAIGPRGFHLPPGGWITDGIELLPTDYKMTFEVTEVIAGQVINFVRATYFAPGEKIHGVSLGNSPIGISGSVNTTNIQTLTNDGNAAGTLVYETTPSDQASSSSSLKNDASGFLKVLSANVLRTIWNVVRGNSGAGKAAITFGDSGDATITTLYGSVLGAQPATLGATTTGALTVGGNITPPAPGNGLAGDLELEINSSPRRFGIIVGDGTGWRMPFYKRSGGVNTEEFAVNDTGGLPIIGGLATIGRGVAIQRARGSDVHVTSTTLTTICSFTVPNESPNPMVCCTCIFLVPTSNTNNGTILIQVAYTDPFDSTAHIQVFNLNGTAVTLLSPATIFKSANQYTTIALPVECKPNTLVSIQYQNTATGTIGDFVTGIIQLL